MRVWHLRSISPGRTTPLNPLIIPFRGGCLKERILLKIINGLRREPRVGWKLAETSKPTTRRFSKTTPSWRDFMPAFLCLLKAGIKKGEIVSKGKVNILIEIVTKGLFEVGGPFAISGWQGGLWAQWRIVIPKSWCKVEGLFAISRCQSGLWAQWHQVEGSFAITRW